ncbi:MAG: hypothetical protein HY543_01965 [Deltaproteobacteria bacterium]|nr:hypothetical protein [Deltaproteobacteria bacterium]
MLQFRDTSKGKVLSAGYPAVEDLIDSEQFDPLNQTFERAYQALEEIARHKRGLRKSRDARKAMRAIERVMDLFRELLAIKYRLQAAKSPQKG